MFALTGMVGSQRMHIGLCRGAKCKTRCSFDCFHSNGVTEMCAVTQHRGAYAKPKPLPAALQKQSHAQQRKQAACKQQKRARLEGRPPRGGGWGGHDQSPTWLFCSRVQRKGGGGALAQFGGLCLMRGGGGAQAWAGGDPRKTLW